MKIDRGRENARSERRSHTFAGDVWVDDARPRPRPGRFGVAAGAIVPARRYGAITADPAGPRGLSAGRLTVAPRRLRMPLSLVSSLGPRGDR